MAAAEMMEQSAEPAATEPQATEAVPTGTADAQSVSGDGLDEFTAKVRAGGEFAEQQVKAAQRELSRVKSKLGPVEKVVDALGGSDNLLNHLRRLNTIVSNPQMRTLIEEFERTGVPPSAQQVSAAQNADAADPYEDPWAKDLRQRDEQLRALQAEVHSLRGERGVEKVQGFFQQFFNEMPLAAPDQDEIRAALADQAQQWSRDPNGLRVLNNMDYPTFRSLALGKLTADQIAGVADNLRQRKAATKAAAATDVPSRVGTQARGPADRQMTAAEAFIEACKREGVDPYRPLLQR